MQRYITSFIFIFFLLSIPVLAQDTTSVTSLSEELREPFFLQAVPLPGHSLALLSPNNLYLLEDRNGSKKRIFKASKSNQLKRVLKSKTRLFLLSDKDLYLSEDHGVRWKNVLNPAALKGTPVTFDIVQEQMLLGTTKGLYSSPLNNFDFKKIISFPSSEMPIAIKFVSENIYFVLTDRSLWKTRDAGQSFEKLLGNIPHEIDLERELPNDIEPISLGTFTALDISANGKSVWVGTQRGIFRSEQGGLQFQKISLSGCNSNKIFSLLWTGSNLVAGTQKGVYLQRGNAWKSLSLTLESKPIYDLVLDQGELLATSDNGVYQIALPFPEPHPTPHQELHYTANNLHFIRQLISSEPTVRDIQKAAIRYSNTRNGKIKSWQIFSRLKSFLPTVSTSIGRSHGNNIDLDRGGTNDSDIYIVGPEDWDKDLDINLSWDLGDLLFSSSQTSIDSREKLMVELRDELVSEVTRLYYERRRLQVDLLFVKPTGKKLLETWLRIDELTAQIDGLTGGYMTKHIKHTMLTLETLYKSQLSENSKH
jgi:hypothetical protein